MQIALADTVTVSAVARRGHRNHVALWRRLVVINVPASRSMRRARRRGVSISELCIRRGETRHEEEVSRACT